jgi:hypothetical protein
LGITPLFISTPEQPKEKDENQTTYDENFPTVILPKRIEPIEHLV